MFARLFVTCLLVALLSGCTSYLPPGTVPISPLSEQNVKLVTIPLPVIATSPNEGLTYGALTALLLHNDRDEVCTLLAPQVNHNDNFGTSFSLYGAYYPSADRSFEGNLSQSTQVNYDYELRLRDQTLISKKLETNAFVYAFSDGSARFFGFQSSSRKEMESNYADVEAGFTVSAGYPLPLDHAQLVVGERLRNVDIDPGAVKGVPYLNSVPRFRDIPGVDGFFAHAQSLALVYNTLDSNNMPTSGFRLKGSIEENSKALGGSAEYRHYDLELKGYYPVMDARFISVARFEYSQTLGEDVPFLERSTLGGENTLRGYGRNRFIDSSFLLLNLEERIRLFRWEVFGVTADWEAAPFIDLGGVMTSMVEANSKAFQFNPGLGLRAVIRPNIVGRIDVGVGKEGPAVFVGLGYPF